MFIRHIFISVLELSFYKVSLRSANRAGRKLFENRKPNQAVAISVANPFILRILQLTPLNAGF
jgi:hypothetical protein